MVKKCKIFIVVIFILSILFLYTGYNIIFIPLIMFIIAGILQIIAFATLPNKSLLIYLEEISKTDEDPLKVLKLRYAKGEISKDEFEQMKKDIKD